MAGAGQTRQARFGQHWSDSLMCTRSFIRHVVACLVCQYSSVDGHVICSELQYACPGAATVLVQVRLKKEVLDESIRGNAKQRALVGAASLNGDQWYVQQASRSARTRTTHSLLACHSRSHTLKSTLFTLGHLSDLHKDIWPAFTLSLHASATSDSRCVTFC